MCLACDLPEILEPAQTAGTDRQPGGPVAGQNSVKSIPDTKLAADASGEHVASILHL